MPAALIIVYGADLGRRFDLPDEGIVTLGRGKQNDIRIDQESVSQEHARIWSGKGRWTIEDRESTNGLWIDDARFETKKLESGDEIRLGQTLFLFLVGEDMDALCERQRQRLVEMDGLTGLLNRRAFLGALRRELNRCRRYGRSLAVLMLQIDGFSPLCLKQGLQAADALLKWLSAVVRQHLGPDNTFARLRGERFGVLLPEQDVAGARKLAERIRAAVDASPFKWEAEILPVTLSIGAAAFDGGEPVEAEELIRESESFLTEAMDMGGDRTVC